MQPVRVPHMLPVVLSREEVARLIAAVRNLKHQTALSVACGESAPTILAVRLTVRLKGIPPIDLDTSRQT
jgi:hypothetical protein